jgi:hypothetical protein
MLTLVFWVVSLHMGAVCCHIPTSPHSVTTKKTNMNILVQKVPFLGAKESGARIWKISGMCMLNFENV